MLSRLLRLLTPRLTAHPKSTPTLPSLPREDVSIFFSTTHNLPHVDWGAVDIWISRGNATPLSPESARRAVAAAWLDELRDSLKDDHRRWRADRVEAVTPLDDRLTQRIIRGTQTAYKTIEKSLAPIRGLEPIPAVACPLIPRRRPFRPFQRPCSLVGHGFSRGNRPHFLLTSARFNGLLVIPP